MCSRQVRTLTQRRAVAVGEDLLRLVDVDDQLRSLRDRGPERRRRASARAVDGLERVALADPAVVAAVEEPDVVDARVAQDQARPRGGDLAGPAARPLLVRVALGVAAVDDRPVVSVGDAERPRGPPSSSAGERRFQSAGSSSQLVSR